MQHEAPVTGAGNDELEQSKERITVKWAIMWRSIILSSLGKTSFPYSQYIRTLRLQDLYELLSEGKFLQTAQNSKAFFNADLARYRVDRSINGSHKRKGYLMIDAEATVNKFAEVITQNTPMLEELSGPQHTFSFETLARSIPRLVHLQSLNIFWGETLQGVGGLLNKHCPLFNTLQIYGWRDAQADQLCAALLSEMRPQSLRSFEVLGMGSCGAETFLALNSHRDSLRKLELSELNAEAMPSLSILRECSSLHTLSLAEKAPPTEDLERRHNDTFLEVIAWLRECKHLRSLTIRNFISGPALLTPILMENDIRLIKLELDNYIMSESNDFHQALAHQPSLQDLRLSGDGVDPGDPDNDLLVEALSKLENLTHLHLKEVSDGFSNHHIMRLARDLPRLKYFGTSGYGVNDDIWKDLASLKSLQILELNALSRFTANGIMDFVLSLGAGNRDMALSINMQENDSEISEEEQTTIREFIHEKLGGRFGLTLWKGNCIIQRTIIGVWYAKP